jgi:hypothetical protein
MRIRVIWIHNLFDSVLFLIIILTVFLLILKVPNDLSLPGPKIPSHLKFDLDNP